MTSTPHLLNQSITIGELAQQLELEIHGNPELNIESLASLASACPNSLCFLQSLSYLKQLQDSSCGAVIVPLDFNQPVTGKVILTARNPQLAFVKAINLLKPKTLPPQSTGIHESAQIAATAKIGHNVTIGANTVVDDGVRLGDNVQVGAGCYIEKDVVIGDNSRLLARVTLCHRVVLGEHVLIHPGVVIGSDGFGLVYAEGDWIKIPHLGSVQIGDRVEIGANTTVDRGALDDTVIEQGVKLDNLIQVAHNVHIGENTAIAACVGIAGSAIIGKNCKISGGAGVLGHLSIADNVTISAMSLVTKSITKSGTYSSGTPLLENRLWHRSNARYKTLDKLAKSVADLEKKYK